MVAHFNHFDTLSASPIDSEVNDVTSKDLVLLVLLIHLAVQATKGSMLGWHIFVEGEADTQ
jgi:hypothetical protein